MYNYIFDIGGVLVSYDFKKLSKKISEMTGAEDEEIQKLFSHELLYMVETGRISSDDFYTRYVSAMIPQLSYEKWLNAFIDHYEVNPPGMKLLMKLKTSGHKVYILSNLAEFHKIALEKKIQGLFEICNRNFFSYELGLHKPEKEIFRAVLECTGEKPDNCVFFDDLEANIKGAEKAGMIGIHFCTDAIDDVLKKIEELEALR